MFNQTWWDKNLPYRMDEFTSWIGTKTAVTKQYLRTYIKNMAYKSVLDLGCGTATEYFAYKEEAPDIVYLGVDSSIVLYDKNTKAGVPMLLAPAEKTGLADSSFDCVFSRHILEHQPDFREVLEEMIRVAKKEAIHIFFIPPFEGKTIVNLNEKENLYHNQYNINDIGEFLASNEKVESFIWNKIGQEVVLHIKLK